MIVRIALILLLSAGQLLAADTVTHRIAGMPEASYLLEADDGTILKSHLAATPRVPASILKILTAWMALEYWGEDYHFSTEFFLDKDQLLWIKGLGDPMLVSEELDRIVQQLRANGVTRLSGIATDDSYYAAGINIDGQGGSDNPYDAPVAPLVANFNTVFVKREHGVVASAEPQTPLTSIARKLAESLQKDDPQRINLRDSKNSSRYLVEILKIKLAEAGVGVGQRFESGTLPATATLLYRHENTMSLRSVIKAMLKYSTNLIANEIFLDLGAASEGPPATIEKAVRAARRKIANTLGWTHYTLVEGAGLSRKNRISAEQMIALLRKFTPYRDLLPHKQAGVIAKTGTLNGVRSYAGYLELPRGIYPFVLMINRAVKRTLRYQLIQEWQHSLANKNE